MIRNSVLCSWLFLIMTGCLAQGEKNIAERLGYTKDTKLLILHADDLGVAHSVNQASFEAFKSGSISSGSIMVPCSWLPEVAEFSKKNPQYDLGLHLTLNAEWREYKWGGVASSHKTATLTDPDGYFFDNTESVKVKANPEEIRLEIQAQIDRAREVGIEPTHIDSHMGALFQTPDIFRVYVETGIKNKVAVFVPRAASSLFTSDFSKPKEVVYVDELAMMNENKGYDSWASYYTNVIKKMKPGLNVLLVHLGHDNDELQAVTVDHPDFGATWRAKDLEVIQSAEFKELLKKEKVQLITWKQIQDLVY